jgi:hypothetical protein
MNTHRRRRDIVGHPRRRRVDDAHGSYLLMLAAGTLLMATTGLWALAQLEQFGPSVGAVIVFKPSAMTTDWWHIKAAVGDPTHVDRLDGVADRRCALSPGVMMEDGGSLVIEARRLSRPPVYRVHWIGGHTSHGDADCGATADLILTRTELMRLANVAGGFDGGLRLIAP